MTPSDMEKVLYGHYGGREQHTVRSRADALAVVPAASAVPTPGAAVTSGTGARCQQR